MSGFDLTRFMARGMWGHGGRLGISLHGFGDDWVEMALPYSTDLIGDETSGVIASGPIIALMDVTTSLAVWQRINAFAPHATLDLRIDYLRRATPGRTVIGRAECLRVTRSIAFTRGLAHDGDPADPIANVSATFMLPNGAYPGSHSGGDQ